MSLLDLLSQQMGGNTVNQISGQTGLDPSTVSTITAAALPMLVGALARNASTEQGAASLAGALSRDHDGSLLDDVSGFLGGGGAASEGASILGHLFGAKQGAVASSLGQATGVDAASATQVLAMLAPIVMAALGSSARQQSSLNPTDLGAMLGQEQASIAQQLPGGLSTLSNLLDANHDGSVLDDLAGLATKFFGSGSRG
jgi:hypothetical protein